MLKLFYFVPKKRPEWVKLRPSYVILRRELAFKWGGRWDLNPRQPESQSGALPTELRPPCRDIYSGISKFRQ